MTGAATGRPGVPVWIWIALFFAISVGYRLSFIGPSPFPVNDGGLFIRFFEEIAAAGFRLPDCVPFNGACLPFAYPPLSFYATAALHQAGIGSLALAKWYPVVAHTLYSALAVLVLGRLLRGRTAAMPASGPDRDLLWLLGSVAFLFQVGNFEYLIMGGGIARATGAVFWALALLATERLCAGLRLWPLIGAGLATGAAVLSHPEWGPAAAVCVSVILLVRGRDWRTAIAGIAGIGAISALVVAPWFWTVLASHGTGPFAQASATSLWSPIRAIFGLADLAIFPAGLILAAALGTVAALRARDPLWIAMVLALHVIVPRSYHAISPLAVGALAGWGIAAAWDWLAATLAGWRKRRQAGRHLRLPVDIGLVLALVLAGFMAPHTRLMLKNRQSLQQPHPAAVEAIRWAARTLPAGTKVVTITGDAWFSDETEEWFAILTPFEVISMVRGAEWLPGDTYETRRRSWDLLNRTAGCGRVLDTLEGTFAAAEVVFDFNDNRCLEGRAGWREIHRTEAAVVHARAPDDTPPGGG